MSDGECTGGEAATEMTQILFNILAKDWPPEAIEVIHALRTQRDAARDAQETRKELEAAGYRVVRQKQWGKKCIVHQGLPDLESERCIRAPVGWLPLEDPPVACEWRPLWVDEEIQ